MVKSEIVNLENEVVMKPCQAPKKGRENETKGKDQSPGKQTAQNRQLFLESSLKLSKGMTIPKIMQNLPYISHSEPAPTSAWSTECVLLLSCGWTSTELIFGFNLVTNSVGNRSEIYT